MRLYICTLYFSAQLNLEIIVRKYFITSIGKEKPDKDKTTMGCRHS